MYYCNCCNGFFENLKIIKEIHFECTEKCFETFYECPVCGSMDITEDKINYEN